MPDVTLSFTIPEAKVAIALEGFLKIYPNNEIIPDPTWIDPEDGSEAPHIPKYTNAQWVKEKIRRIIIRDIRRGLSMIRNETISQIEDTTGIII